MKDKFVTIRMPIKMLEQVDELAIEAMRSRSAQILHMVKTVLESQQKED